MRPIAKISEMVVETSFVDTHGRPAAFALGPFGTPDPSNIGHVLATPDEMLARFAAMCHTNGTSPEVLHNIVNEGIARSNSWMTAHGFTQAVDKSAVGVIPPPPISRIRATH